MENDRANLDLPESDTYFAAAARASPEVIAELSERALADPILAVVFEAVGGYAMVLDRHRQIIAANEDLLRILDAQKGQSVLGLRPGEALHCVNAERGPNGCGTSLQCRHCGAVSAILGAQVEDHPVDGQCTVACCNDGQIQQKELKIRVSPLHLADQKVFVFVFHDVTAVKRRELLDKMFVHDFGNLLTGLLGWADELPRSDAPEAADQMVDLAHRMGEYLDEQRLLLHVESGELRLKREAIDARSIADQLYDWVRGCSWAKHRHLRVEMNGTSYELYTDRQLLMRVLRNLVKNAFEASPIGGTVTFRATVAHGKCLFEVHNPGAMPVDVTQQLFKRPYSTKGPARGLGLHAVQMFGEQCLGGQVTFTSSADLGTTFRFFLPVGEAASAG
jgi:hypothetical protein